MFEDFDDPEPPDPAPIDGVTARGKRLRTQRRMLAGAAVLFVLAGGIATAAAAQGGSHGRVVVSDDQTTTTTAPTGTSVADTSTTAVTATTVPDTTTIPGTTTVPASTTTDTTPATTPGTDGGSGPPATDGSTTTTTLPSRGDASFVTIDYGTDRVDVPAGGTTQLRFTATNHGRWGVYYGDSPCFDNAWPDVPATGAPPYTAGIWPQPYPAKGAGSGGWACPLPLLVLRPGQSLTFTITIVGGYRDPDGNVMPAPPGTTSFVGFVPANCVDDCVPSPSKPLEVDITAPAWPPPASLYTITVPNKHLDATSGDSTTVEMTYTNGLAFAVRMPLYGPCWTVVSGSATVDCSGAIPTVVVGAHQTVDLVGTVWARAGFTASGAPLAPGRYPVDIGDLQSTAYPFSSTYVYFYVTA